MSKETTDQTKETQEVTRMNAKEMGSHSYVVAQEVQFSVSPFDTAEEQMHAYCRGQYVGMVFPPDRFNHEQNECYMTMDNTILLAPTYPELAHKIAQHLGVQPMKNRYS